MLGPKYAVFRAYSMLSAYRKAEPNAMLEEPENQTNEGQPVISKGTLVVGAVFMALPPMIPFYFALTTEDSTMRMILAATGVVMLIANGLILALIHRWLTRYMTS